MPPWVLSCRLWGFSLLARATSITVLGLDVPQGSLHLGYKNESFLIFPASFTVETSVPLSLLKDQSRTRAIFQSPSLRV